MWKDFRVIDADAHMHEPQNLWERYVEPRYRDRVPKVAFMHGTFMVYEPDGRLIPKSNETLKVQGPPASTFKIMEEKYGDGYRTWWAPETRLKDMNRQGWDIQVLLPTANNGFFACQVALKDIELGAAMCRAYNNWCHEYCSLDAKRLKFAALVPGSDVGEMVKEARRAVGELGAVGVRNPLLPRDKWLDAAEYNPIWKLACELDFPILVHGETRQRFQTFRNLREIEETQPDAHDYAAFRCLDHAIAFPFDNMVTLGHYIFSGVLERFPKLKLGILESNAGWIPFWLSRMDVHTHGRYSAFGKPQHLPMLPSEYFGRQCTASCDSDEAGLKYAVEHLNGDNLVWNTDYPHADGMVPENALPEFDAQPIPQEAKRKILWDNAVKLYGEQILS
jgi:predicted TIM-barrel fold metal-dependent hydrolase